MRPAAAAEPPSLLEHFRAVRARTEALAAPLSPEDCQAQSMPWASPVKWNLGHTTWFFETFVLAPFAAKHRAGSLASSRLFNSYYEALGERVARADRGLVTRPSLAEVLEYRAQVDSAIAEALVQGPPAETLARVELGLHHEQQHQELLLTDVRHLFSRSPLEPAYRREPALAADSLAPPPSLWIPHPGGLVEVGHDFASERRFAFDNEGPRHRRHLEPFALASRLVTAGEFREFVEAGGYADAALWLSDGFDLVRREGWTAPLDWSRSAEGWTEFTLQGRVPLREHAPVVHLSYFEADAYARWRGARLPREDEWEVLAVSSGGGTAAELGGNLAGADRLRPVPLHRDTEPGVLVPQMLVPQMLVQQMFGDVWEWTSSAYDAYPGYRPAPGAIGEYNGKFMCDQFVLRGGSFATPRDHLRPTYRNFFPARARWQFTGLRLARDGG